MREFSMYRGVSFDEPNGKWVAKWGKKHLGYYCKEIEAAGVVNKYIMSIIQY